MLESLPKILHMSLRVKSGFTGQDVDLGSVLVFHGAKPYPLVLGKKLIPANVEPGVQTAA
jgi:hypothetical protein